MDAATERNYQSPFLKRYPAISSSDLGSKQRKRIKADGGSGYNDSAFGDSWRFDLDQKRNLTYADHSDPFSLHNLVRELDSGKYGSVTKEIQELVMRRRQLLDSIYAINPDLPSACFDVPNKVQSKMTENVIAVDDDKDGSKSAVTSLVPAVKQSQSAAPVVIIDSDDDIDARNENYISPYLEVNLKKPSENLIMKEWGNYRSPYLDENWKKPSKTLLMKDFVEQNFSRNQSSPDGDALIAGETESTKDKGVYVGTDDDIQEDSDGLSETNSDGLGDIWNEMTVALECSKIFGLFLKRKCIFLSYNGSCFTSRRVKDRRNHGNTF